MKQQLENSSVAIVDAMVDAIFEEPGLSVSETYLVQWLKLATVLYTRRAIRLHYWYLAATKRKAARSKPRNYIL